MRTKSFCFYKKFRENLFGGKMEQKTKNREMKDCQKGLVILSGLAVIWGVLSIMYLIANPPPGFLKAEIGISTVVFVSFLAYCAQDTHRFLEESQKAEAKLRESEERFRNLFYHSLGQVFAWEMIEGGNDAIVKDANLVAIEESEGKIRELFGQRASEIWKDDPELIELLRECYQKRKIIKTEKVYRFRSSGKIRHLKVTFVFVEPKMVLIYTEDITEKKKAEAKLQEVYQIIAGSNSVAITWGVEAIFDDGQRGRPVEFITENVKDIFGYSAEVFTQRELLYNQIVYSDDVERVRQERNQFMDGRPGVFHHTYRIIKPGGETIWVHDSTVPIHNEQGQVVGFQGIVTDITTHVAAEESKNELQRQLQQSQKMEAIGTMASGIAHDFNNLLQIMYGYIEWMIRDKKKEDPDYQKLSEIEKAVQSAAELVRNLLTLSRRLESKQILIDLNEEISQLVTSLLSRTIPQNIEISMNLDRRLKKIKADPVQLKQVIINLAVNSRDAMLRGGRLEIKTKNAFKNRDGEIGPYICLMISDNGDGIPQEVMDRIFDPFFTTKDTGKGTGLGLSMVYKIVETHKGWIEYESAPGKGTTFRIYFPVSSEGQQREQKGEKMKSVTGSETILVVDDDNQILKIAEWMLKDTGGYKVILADSGESAVAIFKDIGKEIDLVMLDIGMRGMSGEECLKILREMNPALKVIIISGYGYSQKEFEGAAASLPKPFQINDSLAAVRKVLDS